MNEEITNKCPKCGAKPMTGRHCLECGWRRPQRRERAEVHGVLADAQEREEVENNNRKALVGLMQEYRITISVKDFDDWRPTQRTAGDLVGLGGVGSVKIVATNGVLAWFVRDAVCLLGHKANFTGKVKPLFGVKKHSQATRPKADSVSKAERPKRKTPTQQAMELLMKLQKGQV